MDSKATKAINSNKPTRPPVAKLSPKKLANACGRSQKLTLQELKELQARLVRCSPWLADPEKPRSFRN
jgi:hypothetical protein